MSIRPRPYGSFNRYPTRRPTFIPRPPPPGGVGAGLGSGAAAGGLAGLIGGLAVPLLCLGCLASLALLGLFATMIAAAAYMNQIQSEVQKSFTGAGSINGLNIMVLLTALVCSVYVLAKHRRGVATTC